MRRCKKTIFRIFELKRLMGPELVLIWPYFSQIIIHLTDLIDLEVFHGALSDYREKFQKF